MSFLAALQQGPGLTPSEHELSAEEQTLDVFVWSKCKRKFQICNNNIKKNPPKSVFFLSEAVGELLFTSTMSGVWKGDNRERAADDTRSHNGHAWLVTSTWHLHPTAISVVSRHGSTNPAPVGR